jgi:hypothetical protein
MKLRMHRTGLSVRVSARAVRRAAAAAVLAAAVGACGSLSASGAKVGAPAGHGPGTAAVRCTAPKLRMALDSRAAGAAAGSSSIPLEFTNLSQRSCRLAGYPVVSFAASAAGQRVGTAAAPDHTIKARPVVLAPGATAHAWLQVTDALNFPAKQCHLVTAGGLLVKLPGQHDVSYLKHAFPACAMAMHGSKVLSVQPIQPGRARRGAAQ